jgi:Ca-activated chloride channel homolog
MGRAVARLQMILLLAAGALLSAAFSPQVFRSGTDLVMLSVTANAGLRPASGLDQADFQVFEDGVPQQIAVFARDPQPAAVSLLIDGSSSMEATLAIAKDAAIGFCRRLRPMDVAQIVSFNTETEILQPFTNDLGLLERAVGRARAGGSTALHTAVYVTLDGLQRFETAGPGPARRRALILLSDGADTASRLRSDDVLDRAKRTDAAIYAIGIRDRSESPAEFREHDYVLRSMTQATGGRLFIVDDAATLPAVYNQIADELANQYTIGYTSKNLRRDGAWRLISVRVNRPGVVARTRAGYFATASKGL